MQAAAAKSTVRSAGSLPESLYGDPQINFTPGDVDALNSEQLNLTGYVPVGGGRGTLTIFGKRFDANRFNVNQAPDPNVTALTRTYTVGGTADWRRRLDDREEFALASLRHRRIGELGARADHQHRE